MTTRVTIDAHAGWSVRVEKIDPKTGEHLFKDETVEPGSVRDFYVHDGMAIIVTEMKMEKSDG